MTSDALPSFHEEAGVCVISYGGSVIYLRASKGLGHLSRLVAAPGTRIPASDLVGRIPGDAREAEQNRINVTKGIKAALKQIAERHPALGLHLEQSVRTGAFCRYTPVLAILAHHDANDRVHSRGGRDDPRVCR